MPQWVQCGCQQAANNGHLPTVNNFTFVALANHDINKARVKSNLIFHKFRGVRFPCGKELETKIQNQSRGYQLEMERDHPTLVIRLEVT